MRKYVDDAYNSGIYGIHFRTSDKWYVGQAGRTMISRRWELHQRRLREGKHENKHLQNAWNKYGEHDAEFYVLEIVPLYDMEPRFERMALDAREQFHMQKFDSVNNGYNISKLASSPRGNRHTEEWKRAASVRMMGNKHPVGNKHTEEWKQWNRERMTGNKYAVGSEISAERRLMLSELHRGNKYNVGKKQSDELRAKRCVIMKRIWDERRAKKV